MSLSNEQILDAIAGMTLLEVMELVKAAEEKFGVTAAAPVAVVASFTILCSSSTLSDPTASASAFGSPSLPPRM